MASSSPAETEAHTLDDELQRLFRGLEVRALPDSLKAVLDQLQDGAEGTGATGRS